MKDYKIKAEMYFTEEELKKVQKIVPKEEFILIQPCDYKGYVKYPIIKFQKIVNELKDKISFYQVGPEVYVKKKTILLDNVKSLLGKTSSFREGVILMKYAKLCLLVEGGLSIASNVVNTKTIATYNASFNPIMTNYDNVIPIHVASKDHNSCAIFTCSKKIKKLYPNGCPKCKELGENHNVDIIINKIKEELNI
jgi:ADP-heptose:LPS heptosyltransferase